MKLLGTWQQIRSSRLTANLAYVAAFQGVNFLLPLINFPYLSRVLGAEKLGQVYFANSIISFLVVVSEFGFNLTAVRQISQDPDNKAYVQGILSRALTLRLLLMAGCLVFLLGLMALVPQIGSYPQLFFLTFLMVPGQALMPGFVFMGLQDLRWYSRSLVLTKVLYTLSLFVLVQSPEDYIWVNGYNGLSMLVSLLPCWWILSRQYGLKPHLSALADLLGEWKHGWRVMGGNLAQTVSAASAVIVLGLVASPLTLGLFAQAEKLVWPIRQVLNALGQALYAPLCRSYHQGLASAQRFNRWVASAFIGGLSVLALGIGIWAEEITRLVAGQDLPQAAAYLVYLAWVPVLASMTLLLIWNLMAMGQNKAYAQVVGFSALFFLVSTWLLSQLYSAWGSIAAMLLTEVVAILFAYWHYQKALRGIHPEGLKD